jgi:RNA polymerase sigma-70 factor (ECF subfamily)
MIPTDCEQSSDEELVAKTLVEADFFACLVNRYQASLSRYISRLTAVSQEEKEDILQNVFLKIYLNLNDFDSGLKFSSWVYRIAHNEVINNFRRNKSRPTMVGLEDEEWDRLASDFSLELETDKLISQEKLERLLSGLDSRYREVLVLRYLEEKDYAEIADILKKPMGTIATLINRAKAKLKSLAAQEGVDF